MPAFVLLDVGRPAEVDATVGHSGVSINATDVNAALGWELKAEGLCKGDTCIPVVGRAGLVSNGAIHLETLADLLGRPVAISAEEGAAYLGPPLHRFGQTVGVLEAPNFRLPDAEGRLHSLSDHLGSKVLLAAWASW